MNRCILCGAPIKNGLGVYCSDCLYEIKRVRLKDEESLEDFIQRMMDEHVLQREHSHIEKLERWLK
ncbi:MAG: hypothetical protein QXG55_04420 [Thermoplasmata archaeon]